MEIWKECWNVELRVVSLNRYDTTTKFEGKRERMRASRDMADMNRIAAYVRDKGECSMGEISLQLDIPVQRQYVLHRAYKRFFLDLELRRGDWRTKLVPENAVTPKISQDVLSAKPTVQ
jgi:hypothetical protein